MYQHEKSTPNGVLFHRANVENAYACRNPLRRKATGRIQAHGYACRMLAVNPCGYSRERRVVRALV